MNKYFIDYQCDSDLSMRYLACFRHASTSTRRLVFVSARIRAGSSFKRFRKMFARTPVVRIPQVQEH
jgi:hypothetical protein